MSPGNPTNAVRLATLAAVAAIPIGSFAGPPAVDGSAEAGDREQSQRPREETWSPLHAYLGIDPETGDFKEPEPRSAAPNEPEDVTGEEGTAEAAASKPVEGAGRGGTETQRVGAHDGAVAVPAPSGRASAGPLPDAAARAEEIAASPDLPEGTQDLAKAVAKVLRDGESAGRVADVLSEAYGPGRFGADADRVPLALTLVLLVYPAYVVAGELVLGWRRRQDEDLGELDARYFRTRSRRRILMAVLIAGAIGVSALLSRFEVWKDPARLTAYAGTAVALSLAAAGVSLLIKYAARRHERIVIRDLRRRHDELRQEVEDLQKRMRSLQLTAGR